MLDDEIISSPEVQVPCGAGITGTTEISGNFNIAEANEPGHPDRGRRAAGAGRGDRAAHRRARRWAPPRSRRPGRPPWSACSLTALFIALVYRLVGFLATLALSSYALLAYAMLVGLGSTLTLPGLAGFVLAIGLAIDANVLVFERAREEYAAHPSAGLRRALTIGFNKAWTAIIDSNVTTLLAAGLLFFLGSGPIKGFGVTLSIGVIASMISALDHRPGAHRARRVRSSRSSGRPAITGLATVGRVRTWLERRNPDLMSRAPAVARRSPARRWCVAAGRHLRQRAQPRRRVHRRPGAGVLHRPRRSPPTRPAQVVADAGFPEATVQETDDDKISVRVGQISDDEAVAIEEALGDAGGGATKERDEKIGASLGDELRNKALIAFAIAFLAQMLYLAIRFKWTFGLAAVLAMFHDVVIVTGVFAWLDKPIDGVFLAAAMTIIGLSVNDTVVVFDRIRERWFGSQQEPFMQVANKAAVETMPRTVNTGLGAMFILAALAVLGGDSLRDFAIALLLGLVIGTYSSVFTATPLLTYFQQFSPLARSARAKRVVRDPRGLRRRRLTLTGA